jgi:hypothetical protein
MKKEKAKNRRCCPFQMNCTVLLTHKKGSSLQCETYNLLCGVCGCLPYIHSHAAFSLMLKGGNLAETVQEQPP